MRGWDRTWAHHRRAWRSARRAAPLGAASFAAAFAGMASSGSLRFARDIEDRVRWFADDLATFIEDIVETCVPDAQSFDEPEASWEEDHT